MAGDWDGSGPHRQVRRFSRPPPTGPSRCKTLPRLWTRLAPTGPRFDLAGRSRTAVLRVGLAYMTVETLFEAMEHERLLDRAAFWADVQAAVARSESSDSPHLRNAAGKLQTARDSLYPVDDPPARFRALDAGDRAAAAAVDRRSPLNIIATGEALEALAREQPARHRRTARKLGRRSRAEPLLGNLRRHLLSTARTNCCRSNRNYGTSAVAWKLRSTLTGFDVQTFASPRGSFHPQTPAACSSKSG